MDAGGEAVMTRRSVTTEAVDAVGRKMLAACVGTDAREVVIGAITVAIYYMHRDRFTRTQFLEDCARLWDMYAGPEAS